MRPSPRVIAEGEEVPEGGGHYQLGKPYQIAGKTYYPSEKPYKATGLVSWYGSDFHGRLTANGEVFDRNAASAAHPTMPLPSYARLTNTENGYSMVVRVNDRGPYHGHRVMDVSQKVAEGLDFHRAGTARVKVEWLGRADINGGDKGMLLASLRTDGHPATLPPHGGPVTQFAERARDSVVAAVEQGEDRLRSVVEREPQAAAPEEERIESDAAAPSGRRARRGRGRERAASPLAPLCARPRADEVCASHEARAAVGCYKPDQRETPDVTASPPRACGPA